MSRYSEGAPMIGRHRTLEDVEAEMNSMGYIPDSPLRADDIQEARQNMSSDILSHAIVAARRFGYSDYNEYMDQALSRFDEENMQQI